MRPKRVLVTGAGGSPATNFVRSLRESAEPFHLIGVDCNKYYLQRAETDERHLVPEPSDADYIAILCDIVRESGAELVYSQTDQETTAISEHRDRISARTFLPAHETIQVCHDKYESFRRWKAASVKVPETILIRTEDDLAKAFDTCGPIPWLRAVVSPGGGRGSFRAPNLEAARAWLDFCRGWGHFTVAEYLGPHTVTWTALYKDGELIVAQSRRRLYWELGNRAPSGVTGITGTGVTVADSRLDEIAVRSIHAVDRRPNGIFAVDLTYDAHEVPNPTEINIGRFFTTHLFFTRAGLNLPYLFVKLACDEAYPAPQRRINPLPPGLAWIRGMDFVPVLTDVATIEEPLGELAERRARLHRQADAAQTGVPR
jgi:carbamoyl-phosphate synthase large subunit